MRIPTEPCFACGKPTNETQSKFGVGHFACYMQRMKEIAFYMQQLKNITNNAKPSLTWEENSRI